MKKLHWKQLVTICLAAAIAFTPVDASAALLRKGSKGTEVKTIQTTLMRLGYFTYPKATGYYGTVTEKAVKKFQKDNGLLADGIAGKSTTKLLSAKVEARTVSGSALMKISDEEVIVKKVEKGDLDWFKEVRYLWARGENATITDVETGKTFQLRRTYGTNHADVEPLTKEDSAIIKELWNGWSWNRRAVVVEVNGNIIAGSLAAMPHAGVDSAPASATVRGRSGGYGWGSNLDAVKGNGASGVLDLHFKNSRTHGSNSVNKAHQDMIKKAAEYIEKNY
ncbi:MAG: putative peptidoglycan-binding protein [Herbinix sp.]|jgi:peptidoglycan hydrolase-like protein with peptidoglycan-binding domain|nr:putative peptidoglycan-binding protein [Herbinix sp.]